MSVRKQSCALCAAFNALTSECRRKSPTAVALNAGSQVQVHGIYPGTKAESWCMDFIAGAEVETSQ